MALDIVPARTTLCRAKARFIAADLALLVFVRLISGIR
jgi:hypothetical protein